jgi:uncharacterized protein YoxC
MEYVMFCFAFDCFTVAKLLVLNRLVEFCRPSLSEALQKKVAVLDRVFRAVVAIGLLLITCCGAAMAYYATRIAAQDFLFAAAFESGDFDAFKDISATRLRAMTLLQVSESVMFSCQVVLLILIVFSFVVVGVMCNRRIREVLSSLGSFPSGNRLGANNLAGVAENRQQILDKAADLQKRVFGTVIVIFVSFILRSIFAALFAVGFAENAALANPACGDCGECQITNYLISRWIINTYEFHNTVSCVSPLALSVALWGMTNQRMRKLISERTSSVNEITVPGSAGSIEQENTA